LKWYLKKKKHSALVKVYIDADKNDRHAGDERGGFTRLFRWHFSVFCKGLFCVYCVFSVSLIVSFPAPVLSHSRLVNVSCRTPVFPPIYCATLSFVCCWIVVFFPSSRLSYLTLPPALNPDSLPAPFWTLLVFFVWKLLTH